MDRRNFIQKSTLATAAVALAKVDILAFPSEPMPINEGGYMLWENFQYVVRHWPITPATIDLDPLNQQPSETSKRLRGRTTVGWKGQIDGKTYGDYIILDEHIPHEHIPQVIEECKVLCKEQADMVRHMLIKDSGKPCYCTMCKLP